MSRRFRVVVVTITLAVLVACGGASIVIMKARAEMPPVPAEWAAITIGMPRDEVLRLVPDEVHDVRDLKGCDAASRASRVLGKEYWWHLLVWYDEAGGVRTVVAYTSTPLGRPFHQAYSLRAPSE